MAKKKSDKKTDHSTQEKIKLAAKKVFHKKGYAATRTRDISDEAGINLALLNYYFRSKEKLFELIILETLHGFIGSLSVVVSDSSTSLEEKVENIISRYIDMLLIEPDIPLFIMSELRNHPGTLLKKLPIRELMMKSAFTSQYQESIKAGKIQPLPLIQFLVNIMGLTVFPFIASPIVKGIGDLKDEQFISLMVERKKMIPLWIKAIMKTRLPQ
jgi:AcrR family transcriptional regulator